jgi:hypothetical protein
LNPVNTFSPFLKHGNGEKEREGKMEKGQERKSKREKKVSRMENRVKESNKA